MANLRDDTQPAMCYPKSRQYKEWKNFAEEMGYESVSRFMIDMVEAGYKQLNLSVENDEEVGDLRRQRNDLKEELDATRRRVEQLESQLYRSEKRSIEDYLEEQNGATFAEIVQHIIDDAPARVAQHLDEMAGTEIEHTDGQYYRTEQDNDEF